MKKRREKKPARGPGWKQALDVAAYDKELAYAYFHVRKIVQHLSLMEVERRSGLSHQFWSNVEKMKSSFSAHHEVLMCNALRVRSSVMHRLAERWVRLGRKLKVLPLWLLPLESIGESMMAGA